MSLRDILISIGVISRPGVNVLPQFSTRYPWGITFFPHRLRRNYTTQCHVSAVVTVELSRACRKLDGLLSDIGRGGALESVCWIVGRATHQILPVRRKLQYLGLREVAIIQSLMYGDAMNRWNDGGRVEPLLPDPPKLKIFKT